MSLVRQLTDADFCSDSHRKRYYELMHRGLDGLLGGLGRLDTVEVPPEEEEPETVQSWEPAKVEAPSVPPPHTTRRRIYEEPEPVLEEPAGPPEEVGPPLVDYFAMMEFGVTGMAAAPHSVELDPFDPLFSGQTADPVWDPLATWGNTFIKSRAASPYDKTFRRTAASGGFRSARWHANVPRVPEPLPPGIGWTLPPQSLLLGQIAPKKRASRFVIAPDAMGRATPRPKLPQVEALQSYGAGMELADLVRYPRPAPLGRTTRRPARPVEVAFRAWVDAGSLTHGGIRNIVRTSGFQPLEAGAVSARLRQLAAPAALFHARPSFRIHAPLRGPELPAAATFAGLPSPGMARFLCHPLAAQARTFTGGALLPESPLELIAEMEIGTPPMADRWFLASPDAAAIAARRMPAVGVVFPPGSMGLPELAAAMPESGLRAPELMALGFAASPRAGTAKMRRVAAVLEEWGGEAAILVPDFTAHGLGCVVGSAAPLAIITPAPPPQRAGIAEQVGPLLAFGVTTPRAPSSPGIAAASREIEEASFADSASAGRGAALPARMVVGAVLPPPEALIEPPALKAHLRTPALSQPAPLKAIAQQRPMIRPLVSRQTATVGFLMEACTPDFPASFESRVGDVAFLPVGDPAAQKGPRALEGEQVEFSAPRVPVPELRARTAAGRLYMADAAEQFPAVMTGGKPRPRIHDVAAIRVSSTVRLVPAGTKALSGARTLEPRTLEPFAEPAWRALPAAAQALGAQEIARQTLLPPAPAPFSAMHALPWPEEAAIVPHAARTAFPGARATACAIAGPSIALPARVAATLTPLLLGMPAAIARRITGFHTQGVPVASGWIVTAPAAPEVAGKSEPGHEGLLGGARLNRGAWLQPALRAPAAATPQETWTPFAAAAPVLPPEHALIARETLEYTPAAQTPPGSKPGSPPAPALISFGFRLRPALLPEIGADSARARISAARRLTQSECEPLASPASRDIAKTRQARTTAVAVPLSEPLGLGAGAIRPIRPFALTEAGLGTLPSRKPRTITSAWRGTGRIGFPLAAPIVPASKALTAAERLDSTPPAAVSGRTVSGRSKPAAASVVPVSTQAAELPAAMPLTLKHPLASVPPSVVNLRKLDRPGSRTAAGWEAFGQESSKTGFESIRSAGGSARWPSVSGQKFAHEPERPAKKGAAAKIDPRLTVEFAAPAPRRPQSAGYVPALGNSPAAKTPPPALRRDARTEEKKPLLAPIFRLVRHASRLPVFHTLVDKAHMPFGVFRVIEIEDWDDANASKVGAPCPAPLLEPRVPASRFATPVRHGLEMQPPAPVLGDPYVGNHLSAQTYGEQPFALELLLMDGAVEPIRLDLTPLAESYAPGWRGVLKTASGLFRSVVIVIPCVLALSGILTGCSARGGSLRESIQNRAALYLEHDFSKGLEGWTGGPEWDKTWIQDPAGFAYAGRLALYKPSLSLADYQMEFLGQIDGESMGWAYRAADVDNYYAAKLVVVKPGPAPQLALVRYEMAGGQETERVQVPVRVLLPSGRPYRIRQIVAGAGFTTVIEGEVVDSWSSDRLRAGGVGFFADAGSKPHIYWMKLSNNDDFWGKLCGTLAPKK